MPKRAPFIVIEGLDRSGKSTQTSILIQRLLGNGIPAKLFKFPDRTTPIGKMINSYLQSQSNLDDRSIHLLFSANRWEQSHSIEESLKAGTMVICDRYAFSGIAFSASKGIPYSWCLAPEISLPAPDLTLFLDILPEKAQERGGYGDERYEREDVQKRVRDVFERIGRDMNAAHQSGAKWMRVDASDEVDAVAEVLWKNIEPLVEGTELPIQRLWEENIL